MSREHDDQEHREFQEVFQRFILEHGVLFERKMMPMDAADRKRAGEFSVTMLVLLLIFSIGYLLMLYFKWPQTLRDQIYAWGMGLLIGGGFVGVMWVRKSQLTKNEKTTFKGVITRKWGTKPENKEKTIFQLSNVEEFFVISKDHEKYVLGEIVQIEYLGNYPELIIAYPKVVPIGKLPFVHNERRPEVTLTALDWIKWFWRKLKER